MNRIPVILALTGIILMVTAAWLYDLRLGLAATGATSLIVGLFYDYEGDQ